MYRSYSFLTSALNEVSGQRHAPTALYSRGKDHGTHWVGDWWVSELLWTQRLKEKYFACPGDPTLIVQPAVTHYTYHSNSFKRNYLVLFLNGIKYLQHSHEDKHESRNWRLFFNYSLKIWTKLQLLIIVISPCSNTRHEETNKIIEL